ncbi:GFA family protein [Qipengyuania sp. 6B39]|uniref:GFA family protein n=1 Tax=Qipengyuania proteolytica TaxID=2867239 RepID=UPI001C89B174|nr:GFA family protein [Qipengyuania proteolytica]MBX7495037.1 GFA family protein [Qipengyuania proteolytica]
MSRTEGGCLCGKVRYGFDGEPAAAMVCHCTHCQKQSGSAFSTIIGVPESALEVRGTPTSYADSGESGKSVERIFCGTCGSPLISKVEVAPGMAWIKAGTLDDTGLFDPAMHIWTRSKQCWVDTGALPAFDTNPA